MLIAGLLFLFRCCCVTLAQSSEIAVASNNQCKTVEDIDKINCNLEDLSDAVLSDVCIHARRRESEWLNVKDVYATCLCN